MLRLLKPLTNLIFENSCLICSSPSENTMVCKNCKKGFHERNTNFIKEYKFLTVYSWGYYDGTLRDGILRYKNGGQKELASFFSEILITFWKKIIPLYIKKNFTVIPVPSHTKRIQERGYCHTALVAKLFAQHFTYIYLDSFAKRIKYTKYMNKLTNIKERIENINGAFEINAESQPLQVKNILIIDDILTSGNTLCELARTIKTKHPNTNINGLTLACGDTLN